MPYITQVRRAALAQGEDMTGPGELNYLICRHYVNLDETSGEHRKMFKEKLDRLITLYVEHRGLSYQTINDVMGVLECVRDEMLDRARYRHRFSGMLIQASEDFYKTVARPYEALKRAENGDIL